jgi:hypothetical protein
VSLERYRAIVIDQQRKIDRLVRAGGVTPVRRVYEEILRELTRAVASLPVTFDQTVKAGMLAQARAAMSRFVAMGADELSAATAAAMSQASSEAFRLLSQMEHQFAGAVVPMPINEIALLKRATNRASSLLSVHRRSLARYGAHVVIGMETQTAVGLALGESTSQIIDRIQGVADTEWWQGERIVRTEMAYAYNAGHRDAIEIEAEEMDGDVWSQWSEHATADGAPLDNRVAVDSLAMHGQIAGTCEVFTQPPTSPYPDARGRTDVPPGLVGQTWEHPPNRPNDRSTLVPWRPHWNVPGWVWRDGRRVQMAGRTPRRATG